MRNRYFPDYEYMSFPSQNISYTNTYTGGPFQQAVSGTTTLNNDWYDGKEYQKYAFEYQPGTGKDGWITWSVGDDVMFTMDGRAIRANGNVGDRVVSEEPMSMILNLGFSNSWVAIDFANLKFPTVMRVDYVRLYQKEGEEMVTCDPPGYETTDYIANHMDAYTNPNFTVSLARTDIFEFSKLILYRSTGIRLAILGQCTNSTATAELRIYHDNRPNHLTNSNISITHTCTCTSRVQ